MKSLFLAIALLMAPVCLAQNSQSAVLSWTDGSDNPTYASTCATGITKNCLTGVTLTDTTGSTPVVLASNVPFSSLSFTLPAFPSAGTHTYSMTLSGYNSAGKLNTTAPITTSVIVPMLVETYPTSVTILNPGS